MDTAGNAPQFSTAEFEDRPPDTHSLFGRAVIFGAAGASLGLMLYSAVGIITGLSLGIVSLAVGYIVGQAVVLGSKGQSGRRYQVLAVILTYVAVSLSVIPIGIAAILRDPSIATKADSAAGTTDVGNHPATPPDAPDPPVSRSHIIGMLVMYALASPFLDLQNPGGGLMGLLILGIGLRIAWRTAGGTPARVRDAMAPMAPADDKPTSLNLNR
jgi:hypothetical protein